MSEPPVHTMLSVRTLGARGDAALAAIAAVAFWDKQALITERRESVASHSFYSVINMSGYERPQVKPLFEVSAVAVTWWLEQPEEEGKELLTREASHIETALDAFTQWLQEQAGKDLSRVRLWSDAPAFHNAVLRHAYRSFGVHAPWSFHNDRCYRTLKGAAPHIQVRDNAGEARAAIADAHFQALHVLDIAEQQKLSLDAL